MEDMLNRKVAPTIHQISIDQIPKIESTILHNDVKLYTLNFLQHDIMRVQFVLDLGKVSESKKMQLYVLSNLIKEGTKSKSAKQIADTFDYYGANIKSFSTSDVFNLQLTCLNRFFEDLFPLFMDIFLHPIFPEKELQDYKSRQSQMILVKEQQVEFLADRLFFETLFGKDHFYGYGIYNDYLSDINQSDLLEFHQENFFRQPISVYVSGKFDQSQLKVITNGISSLETRNMINSSSVTIKSSTPLNEYLKKEDALQSAIRIGRNGLPSITDPDYAISVLTNLIFGGYFGSRLMSNIREEKGYTYGIYSISGQFKQASYWEISTETGASVAASAKVEIYKEMNRMRNELVEEGELNLAKNYFSGNLLNRLNGAFNIMLTVSELNKYGCSLDFYSELDKAVKSVTAKQIMDFASIWYNPDDLTEVVVGP